MAVGAGIGSLDCGVGVAAVVGTGVGVLGSGVGTTVGVAVGTGELPPQVASAISAASARPHNAARYHTVESANTFHEASIIGPLLRYQSTILFHFLELCEGDLDLGLALV